MILLCSVNDFVKKSEIFYKYVIMNKQEMTEKINSMEKKIIDLETLLKDLDSKQNQNQIVIQDFDSLDEVNIISSYSIYSEHSRYFKIMTASVLLGISMYWLN